ncbi:MAG: hypothetical protein LUE92_06025 [Clostridiales bacterium]|nr:hypothetical protein [Clostridiales bacterium]
MSSPSLSNESIALLRAFMENTSLSPEQLEGYPDACLDQLSDAGFVESHVIDLDMSPRDIIAVPIYSDFVITETGKAYIEGLDRRIHEKRWENTRYAITTGIAVIALVVAIASIYLQYLGIFLPTLSTTG